MMVVHAGALLPPCNLHVGSDASSCARALLPQALFFCNPVLFGCITLDSFTCIFVERWIPDQDLALLICV
ncbi:unnamed protein product [Musa acuminata var. zebrina]